MFESGAFSEVADDELDGSPIGAGGLIGVLMAEGDATIDVSESFSTGEVAATGIRTDVHLGGFIGGVIAEAGSAISVSESFSTGEVSFSQPTLEGRRIDSDVIELSDIGMILGKVHVCGLVGTAQVGAMGGAATIEFSDVFSTVEIEITIRTDGFDISAGGLTGAATADGEVNEVSIGARRLRTDRGEAVRPSPIQHFGCALREQVRARRAGRVPRHRRELRRRALDRRTGALSVEAVWGTGRDLDRRGISATSTRDTRA